MPRAVRTDIVQPDGRHVHLYGDFEPAPAGYRAPAMPNGVYQRRWNPLRREWVLVAASRQARTFLPERADCPLCPSRPDHSTEIPAARFQAAVFENRGEQVGVTLHHPHGQIYAYPFVPPVPATELGRHAGGCLQCELVRGELTARHRVLINDGGIVAYVPESARWPYEVHVATRAHRPALPDVPPAGRRALLAAMQRVTRAYDRLFEVPMPYMMSMHQSPAEASAQAHLHVEFYPIMRDRGKLKFLAGSESGAGVFINDTLAEESADRLRGLLE